MGYSLKRVTLPAVVAVLCLLATGHPQGTRIAILASDSLTSTKRTLSGAKKVITRAHPEVHFVKFLVGSDTGENNKVVDSIKGLDPRLILTVGSFATRLAQDNFENTPIVFSAVMYPVLSGFVNSVANPGANITGASLDIPFDIQFKHFKKIVPSLKRVGVLYTGNTASLIPAARRVAEQLGFHLISIKVDNDKSLPAALDSLTGVVDGLWSVADPNLFKPKSTRYILLNSLRKGIPFMGFSQYVVESGALFALDFDYKAVGFQAGAIACRIIEGEPPGTIRVTSADVIWFHYNENTARRINVSIPEELAAVAKEVYR